MHEWDVAASNPCPFCPALRRCPHDRTPNGVCLELWPLSRPRERALVAETVEEARCKRIALADPQTRRIVAAWCRGERVSDDDYLILRERRAGRRGVSTTAERPSPTAIRPSPEPAQ